MSGKQYVLSIDQGTSSTKTLIFDELGKAVAKGSEPLHTSYFNDGYVEQDPEGIYQNVLASVRNCLNDFELNGGDIHAINALGISNQRETFVVWDKAGKPLHNAIVWQCKRSVGICDQLIQQGLSEQVSDKTGLVIDPYFSATKLIWLNQLHPELAAAIQKGNAYFGTVDTWLLYKLTKGASYKTDYTNASRTLMFNLHSLQWDASLIEAFGLTGILLPELQASASFFGETDLDGLLPENRPVTAMIGDSHAAAFGEGCFEAGSAKATLGTGCSLLMNVGDKPVKSLNGMVSTICWSTADTIQYALEGVVVSCGATIEWLKNELQLFTDSSETADMALSVKDNGGVYLIPAFSGLGSPHWQMDRKASVNGLTFGNNKNHIVRAALESIPYQIKDITTAMASDAAIELHSLNVDGGISRNPFVMSFLSTLLKKDIYTVRISDVSALGAGLLAGLQSGIYKDLEYLSQLDLGKSLVRFEPNDQVDAAYMEWTRQINLPYRS